MNYFCCDELRRGLLKHSAFNGIDYLEVLDQEAPSDAQRQRTLFVHVLNPLATSLGRANVRVEGGERIRGIKVVAVVLSSDGRVLSVEVDPPGDFSIYTLRLVRSETDASPPEGIDPLYAAVEFSFKVECPSDYDCQTERVCPPETVASPEIDYLAKDYATFRRLMLDRMTALVPEWKERNPADYGVALVELLAYVGDHLSYQQDAVATEAYLGTARRRVSVRRHARLVDYLMHDGGNARVWLQVTVDGVDRVRLSRGTTLVSRLPQVPRRIAAEAMPELLKQHPVVFETMSDTLLFAAHNELSFYTWGNARCCLPRGATRATLRDDPAARIRLRVGDVLIFEERLGPNTGLAADADPLRRHAVRLTRVSPEADIVRNDDGVEVNRQPGPLITDAIMNPTAAVVEIEWATGDALPFALCLSAVTDEDHGGTLHANVSVAVGNIVLADHGRSIKGEKIGVVSPPIRYRTRPSAKDRCAEGERLAVPARFNPTLAERPLTQAATLSSRMTSAQTTMKWSARDLLPAITLSSDLDGDLREWHPQRDLLGSDKTATEFVVEIEHDGIAAIRFGDGEHGRRPLPDTAFTASYRVGNGAAGNVGAGALWHIVSADAGIVAVRNPMPAQGGFEPETAEEVRQRAPSAFRTQLRAVTEADYAEVTERDVRVQQARALLRWTGSWHTVFVTVDPFGGTELDPVLESQIESHVDRYRMAGHDLEIDAPVFVPLEIDLHVCVRPDYFRSAVKKAMLDLFSNRVLPDGRRGLFHPDKFSFGQTVYLSPLYAAAQSVPGVTSVQITTFKRRASTDRTGLAKGSLQLGRKEIAQLDNDRNFAERGVFRLTLGGGK